MKRSIALFLAVGAACACTGAANAELVYGISGSTAAANLVRFDSATPGGAVVVGGISGALPGHGVTAIDFRPATSQLYAVSVDFNDPSIGQLYTVDLNTGALTTVGSGFALTGNTSIVSIDFNPTVDRLRIITGNNKNYRVNPNNGALVLQDGDTAYAAGDVNAGSTPAPIGAAYTNNFAGALTTTLFTWDFNLDRLATVIPPNSGTLNTIGGPAGFLTNNGDVGFDISGATGTAFFSYNEFNSGEERFGTMNLGTGIVTDIGNFNLNMIDISVAIPTPGAMAMLGLGALAIGRRRRA